ncbi:hypothetical protein BpHYR1_033173 [Brachionus plicatilis]|uniref:Uncharacterized protein n=1 Tax=Brachionus plicatilis TaxID=10195 RepID=A0A3M7QLP3_BRAPC|nr:hypothetical protein BpHYR1_033173 [Brachionus plicatilis]
MSNGLALYHPDTMIGNKQYFLFQFITRTKKSKSWNQFNKVSGIEVWLLMKISSSHEIRCVTIFKIPKFQCLFRNNLQLVNILIIKSKWLSII